MKLESSETKRLGFAMNLEAQWIVGFVDGKGSFHISVERCEDLSIGYIVLPKFIVVQYRRDAQVLYAFKAYFKCGVVRDICGNEVEYCVGKLSHLTETIVPFFGRHLLKTKKRVEFQNFCKVLFKMQRKEHLTLQGIEEIRKLKGKIDLLAN